MKKKLYLLLLFCTTLQAQFITGGYPININQAPYQASLQINGQHNCGCSILNNQWLLTAAHCVKGASMSSLTVKTGITSLNNPTGNSGTYSIQQIEMHPNYNTSTSENDLALIKISGNLTFNPDTLPISIAWPSNNLSQVGQNSQVSGWGYTTPGTAIISDQLMMTNVPVISNATASSQLDTTFPAHPSLTNNMISTSAVGGVRQGACHGDSGGPLTTTNSQGITKQIGVVSWGVPTCVGGSNSPSIYTKVENYISWIYSYAPPINYALVGSNAICGSSTSQTNVIIAPPPPPGSLITWTSTPNIIINNTVPPNTTNASQIIVKNNIPAGTYQTGTVTATINGTPITKTFDIGRKPFDVNVQKTSTQNFVEYCDPNYHYLAVDITNTDTTGSYNYTFGNIITGISNPGVTYIQTSTNRFVFKIPLNKIMTGSNPILGFSLSVTTQCDSTPYMSFGHVVIIGPCSGYTGTPPPGLKTSSIETQNVYTIFPNPTGGILNISLNNSNSKQIKNNNTTAVLYDLNGLPKENVTITGSTSTLDVSKYAKGIYILKIENGENSESHQIIVK